MVHEGIPAWLATAPAPSADFDTDVPRFGKFWRRAAALLAALPAKPRRSAPEADAATTILGAARAARECFLGVHAGAVYDRVTAARSRFVRIEDLVWAAADAVPGLAPTRAQVAAEAALPQGAKDGAEIDQGILAAHLLADEAAGRHLIHAMLLPRPETPELAARLARDGAVDLGAAHVMRRGRAAVLELRNPGALNAEDDTTLDAAEIGAELAILDPATEVAVLRGGAVDHRKHAGRRILGSGINLTHLHQGRVPYVWFPRRELGLVHKLLRGVARPEALPDDVRGFGIEKPWIGAVEGFAIGGHCQILLTLDYVIAGADAYMTLPARKEGIIPGLANLRLPRFVGDRIARQAIQYDRRLDCDSAEGRMICDEIVAPGAMDAAIDTVVAGLTSSGAVSAIGNRRAFRIGQEPLDVFRRYCALYAREHAYCHFSAALIANLERHWLGRRTGSPPRGAGKIAEGPGASAG